MANKKKEVFRPGPMTEGNGISFRDCCRNMTFILLLTFRKP